MRLLVGLLLLVLAKFAFAGYDLHLTRKAHWADERGPKVTLAEWRAYVKGDKQIVRDANNSENDFLVTVGGEVFPLCFEPSLGELRTKNPSPVALKKLIEISKKLKVKVQGDDGEFYPQQP